MNGFFVASFVEPLGWMLLSFVWQGTVIAAALWCFLRLVRNTSAQLRYGAACAALLLMLMSGLATFVWSFAAHSSAERQVRPASRNKSAPLDQRPSTATGNAGVDLPSDVKVTGEFTRPRPAPRVSGLLAMQGWLRPWLLWVVGLWVIGVVFHSLCFFVGWRAICGMRAAGCELEDDLWTSRFDRLRKGLGVSSSVRLLASASATVPLVIGCLKPVVLVPTSLLTGLNTSQVEAILVHELIHIRRHDYLVNLVQNVVETLFFYHPALWWVSAQVRKEREHCCDDVASAVCGNVLDYVHALTALEELRGTIPACSVAASGGSLVERVRRLTADHQPAPNRALWPASMLALLILLAAMLPLAAVRATETATTAEAVQQESAEEKPQELQAASLGNRQRCVARTIYGNVVDDETGEPVTHFTTQTGRFDPAEPDEVYRESPTTDGYFSVPWSSGWTARIVADGYLPQPVIAEAPAADQESIEVTIRLKRGRLVHGRVVDHTGQSVSGASVFAIGPRRINLYDGKAWIDGANGREIDELAKPVQTDDDGRFEIPAGGARTLAVSYTGLNAWAAPLPEEGDAVIRLPAPARIEILYDIQGGDAIGQVSCQMIGGDTGVRSFWMIPVQNPGRLELTGIAPGNYVISRWSSHDFRWHSRSTALDPQSFEVQPGETKTIRLVRERGALLSGRIAWPPGSEPSKEVSVTVWDPETHYNSFGQAVYEPPFACQKAADDGTFHTERIPPGRYRVVADAYSPPGPLGYGGGIGGGPPPTYRAEMIVEVTATGEVVLPDLLLEKDD